MYDFMTYPSLRTDDGPRGDMATIFSWFFLQEEDCIVASCWPYVLQLNRLERNRVFLERASRVLVFNDTPFHDAFVSFHETHLREPSDAEMSLMPAVNADDTATVRALKWIEAELQSCGMYLSEALCAVHLPSQLSMSKSYEEAVAAGTSEEGNFIRVEPFSNADRPDIERYLKCVLFATAKIQNLKTWLDVFRSGYVADHAKRRKIERTASEAGKRSGEVRAADSRAQPEAVHEAASVLRKSGHPSHAIASTLAMRLHVSADHIRRILRSPPF